VYSVERPTSHVRSFQRQVFSGIQSVALVLTTKQQQNRNTQNTK